MTRKAAIDRPTSLVTIGDHLRKARRERKLTQADAAVAMGVSAATVANWESGKTEPPIALWPRIIGFLGYDPVPTAATLPERMYAFRRRNGLSIKDAAARAGVDEGTWGCWERSGEVAWERYRIALESLLADALR